MENKPKFDLKKVASILRRGAKRLLETKNPKVRVVIKDNTLYFGATTVREDKGEFWIENFWAFVSNKEDEAVVVHLEHSGSDIWNAYSGYITLFDDGKVVANGSYYTVKALFEKILKTANKDN